MSDALSACFCPFPVHVLVSRLPDDPFSAEAKNRLPCRTERPDDAAGILNSPLHLVLLSLSIFSCSHWQQQLIWSLSNGQLMDRVTWSICMWPQTGCELRTWSCFIRSETTDDVRPSVMSRYNQSFINARRFFLTAAHLKIKPNSCRCGLDRAEEEGFISERKKRVKAWLHVAKKDDSL